MINIEGENKLGFIENRRNYIMKSIIVFLSVIIIVGLFTSIFGVKRSIDEEYKAIQFRTNDLTEMEHTTIEIKGKLHKGIFKKPKFVGSIVIGLYEFTKRYELNNLTFTEYDKGYYGYLSYHANINGKADQKIMGDILISEDFKEIVIYVVEQTGSNEQLLKELIISAPSQTLNEAIEIYERLGFEHYPYWKN